MIFFCLFITIEHCIQFCSLDEDIIWYHHFVCLSYFVCLTKQPVIHLCDSRDITVLIISVFLINHSICLTWNILSRINGYMTIWNKSHYSDIIWVLIYYKSLATQLVVQQVVKAKNKRKHLCSALLALCERNPLVIMNSSHKVQVMQEISLQ